MGFIKLYPLVEIEPVPASRFGFGEPARCRAEPRFGTREYALHVDRIAAFEECPLYILSRNENNALIDGIRLQLVTGECLIVPDDNQEPGQGFADLLRRACAGEIVEMPYSVYLRQLEREGGM